MSCIGIRPQVGPIISRNAPTCGLPPFHSVAGSEQLIFTSSGLLVVSIQQASNVARRSQVQPLGNPGQCHRCLPPQACGHSDLPSVPLAMSLPVLICSPEPRQFLPKHALGLGLGGRPDVLPRGLRAALLAHVGQQFMPELVASPTPARPLVLAGSWGSSARFHSPGKLAPPRRPVLTPPKAEKPKIGEKRAETTSGKAVGLPDPGAVES